MKFYYMALGLLLFSLLSFAQTQTLDIDLSTYCKDEAEQNTTWAEWEFSKLEDTIKTLNLSAENAKNKIK
jgi:hypothetical protein